MNKKKSTQQDNVKNEDKVTVRQYFYLYQNYNENLIKTLERTYREFKKTDKEWSEIMKFKKIVF